MSLPARIYKRSRPLSTALVAIAALTCACATPPPTEAPEGSGFLGNYDDFQQVPDRPGAMRWLKEGATLAPYDKVLLDPIVVWYTAREEGVDPTELQKLADSFKLEIHRALGEDYPLTLEPGPDVMRLRIAITDVRKATGMRKTMRVLSGPGSGTTGYDAQYESELIDIDAMAIEAEILDSVSSERLAAVVEGKIAPPKERSTDTWRSINGALRQWAQLLREALDEDHAR
jgi:hypothetical protein